MQASMFSPDTMAVLLIASGLVPFIAFGGTVLFEFHMKGYLPSCSRTSAVVVPVTVEDDATVMDMTPSTAPDTDPDDLLLPMEKEDNDDFQGIALSSDQGATSASPSGSNSCVDQGERDSVPGSTASRTAVVPFLSSDRDRNDSKHNGDRQGDGDGRRGNRNDGTEKPWDKVEPCVIAPF